MKTEEEILRGLLETRAFNVSVQILSGLLANGQLTKAGKNFTIQGCDPVEKAIELTKALIWAWMPDV
jgi:hypothetical protein